jgi:beta-phosphoglucomutase-like phosphatase (HAD superfamily)
MSFADGWSAAIFDFDGTLVDSMGIWDRICRDWLAARGKAADEALERDIEHMTLRQSAEYVMERDGAGPGYGRTGTAASCAGLAAGCAGSAPCCAEPAAACPGPAPCSVRLMPGSARAKSDAIIAEWLDMVRERYERDVAPKPGALDYLRALRARGVKLAIATSCFPEACEAVLRKYGARDLFSVIVYTDEADGGEAAGEAHESGAGIDGPHGGADARARARDKRQPDIWLLCARRLGARPEECAVFEDMRAARAGAKAAGMAFIAVADASNAAEWPLMRGEADCAVESFERLPAAIAAG